MTEWQPTAHARDKKIRSKCQAWLWEYVQMSVENRAEPSWRSTKSNVKRDFKSTVNEIFDPNIDAVFFGSLMCYAWRSGRVSNRISAEELSQDLSKPKACYHVALNYLYCLTPQTPALHLSDPFMVNFWHEGTIGAARDTISR